MPSIIMVCADSYCNLQRGNVFSVDAFARRLQIQERLTQEVAQTIQEIIDPLGVGVICEARHFCMMMRGVEKQHSGAMTSAMLGAFRARKKTRDEFLALVNYRGNGF